MAAALKPRSIVFDLYGDHLRHLGGGVRMRVLTELLEQFGVGESTTRVVLSRLRREGWFSTGREGRETVYTPSARAAQVLEEGRTRIFERIGESWDGNWRMVIYEVAEQYRSERERARRALSWHGFGPLATATWVSPHARFDQVGRAFADLETTQLELLTCRTSGPQADREMAARCWDLTGLNRDYTALAQDYERLLRDRALDRLRGPAALVAQVELVHSYRKLPFIDPDLPAKLLPRDWAGGRAHDLFLTAHDALHGPADTFVGEVVRARQPSAAAARYPTPVPAAPPATNRARRVSGA